MGSGSDTPPLPPTPFPPHLQGAQVFNQLLCTGHPQQDRADTLTAETPRWAREGNKKELVGNSEHADFRGVSEEEGPPQRQTSLRFGSISGGDKSSAGSRDGSVSPIASCATVQPSW